MDARGRLFTCRQLYNHKDTNTIFLEAMRDAVQFHRAHCPEYDRVLESAGFSSEQLKDYGDLQNIPAIPTLFLKAHTLLSIDESKLHLKSTTSGTKGNPSQVGLDAMSLYYGFRMLRKACAYHRLFSVKPTNTIILGYQPSRHNTMGAVKTAFGATLLAPARHKVYALKDTGSSYEINITGIRDALLRYSRQRSPVRLIGFPAYMHFLLKELQKKGIALRLPKHSMVMLGGGWKQFASERVDKPALYHMIEDTLGIPQSHCVEFFGVVEHQIPYFDCPNHHFHVPSYSRVLIRDVKTLAPLGYGRPGLLNLMTPLLRSMPLHSVLTDDIAVMYDGKQCGCGIETPYFEVLGRAGVQGIKTCAAGASEALEVGMQ